MRKSGLKVGLVLFTIIILSHQVLGLQITGIMFNPDGADTGREWIEIKLNSSDGCINLTEYKLFEEDTNHNIYKYDSDIFCKYAILSSDVNKFLQDYPYSNNTNNSNQSDIKLYKSTFSLSNSGEDIAIKKGNEIIDEINYTLLIENLDTIEGHSLEYYSDYWRVSELSKGNPGRIIVENTTANITINNETTINTTINDIANNSMTNETEETNNTTDINANNTNNSSTDNGNNSTNNKCNITLSIIIKNSSTSSTIYENDASIKFQNKIEKDNRTNLTNIDEEYVIEYWIEDLFGNIVKNKISTTNQDEKSFTPKIDEMDQIFVIKSVLKNISCELSNASSIYGEKIILVKNSKYTPYSTATSTSKQSTCSACSSKAATCESNAYQDTLQKNTPNCSSLIKIINVCNTSKETPKETQKSIAQNSFELSQAQIQNFPSTNVSSKSLVNSTQNAGQTTGMLIYESPNLKNRLYALIGLILVGLTCITIIVYKLLHKT